MTTTSGLNSSTAAMASRPSPASRDDLHVWLRVDQQPQPLPDGGVIVGEHDAQAPRRFRHRRSPVGCRDVPVARTRSCPRPVTTRRATWRRSGWRAPACRPAPCRSPPLVLLRGLEPHAVVLDDEHGLAVAALDDDVDTAGGGVLGHVVQRLLGDAVEGRLRCRPEPLALEPTARNSARTPWCADQLCT